MNWFDSAGRRLQLGTLLGKGGEGAVYDLAGTAPPRVAKLYHKPPPAAKVDKLRAMVGSADASMLRVAAWPVDTIHVSPSGPVAGLVMPKVSGYGEIHLLYSPAHRRSEFPRADWGLLVQAARNVAAAVETVHGHGHVIGDVNQKNFTVAADATVKLVDCDSFQIVRNGAIYPCEVGVAHFTPPELQGRPFRGVQRTPNHDAFGLAVLCFHLLFMGRHPYAGRYLKGDLQIEQAIREHRFSFGAAARRYLMEPPPNALSLAALSPRVAGLFEQAFGESTAHNRPSASQWRGTLEEMGRQLKRCSRIAAHTFYASSASCTWCELEGRSGAIFFLGVSPVGRVSAAIVFDIAAAWKAVEAVLPPRALPPLAAPTIHGVVAQPIDGHLVRRRRIARTARLVVPAVAILIAMTLPAEAAAVLIVLAAIIPVLPLPARDEAIRRKAAFQAADDSWKEIQTRWLNESGPSLFESERSQLRKKRDEYHDLDRNYARERGLLEAAKREKQLEQFLDRYFIDHAKIPKIGPGRKATLASYGVETAADVTYARLHGVPGFGPTLVASLMVWRAGIERKFTFNPMQQLDPRELARLDQRFEPPRKQLQSLLRAGPARLVAIRHQVEARRAQLRGELEARAVAWAQARADLDALQ